MTSPANIDLARHLVETRNLVLSTCETEFEDALGPAIYPALLGRMLSILAEGSDDDHGKYDNHLTEIPSETSVAERRFLFNFFRHLWRGHYNVLEIGPFLGGATRAIAMGMLLSRNRIERCRLHTFDKFDDYYDSNRLLSCLSPLFKSGALNLDAARHIKETTEFQTVFRMLHEGCDYYKLIQHTEGRLPNTPDEVHTTENLFSLSPGLLFDAVFVDGCKSWFGTKFFMQAVSERTAPGSYVIFQDYGVNTCFWIPVFVGMMADYFKLVAHVDSTYTFRMLKPLAIQEIDSRFPDSPEEMGRSNFDLIFRELLIQAAARDDSFAMMNYHLQHAAALAYIGLRDEAREKILDLLHRAEYTRFRKMILAALEIPTYRPNEGNINL